ncbi:MAG: acyltransferase family protein [Phycisphaerales bacterium]
MDAVRGVCTTAIVALHAATPYVALDLPHLLWPVTERGGFGPPDWLFWTVRCFARGTLFLIAGFASMAMLTKLGPVPFLRRRSARLAMPLVAGSLTVLPAMYLVWAWGWVRSGLALPKHIVHFRFRNGIQPELYGFGHLWFLWYLLLVSVGLALVAMWAPRLRLSDRACALAVGLPGRTLLIGVPVAMVVFFAPQCIFDFRNGFIPQPAFLAYHMPFFVAGACMFRVRDRLAAMTRLWWIELALVCGLLPVLMTRLATRAPGATDTDFGTAAAIGAIGALASCGLLGWSCSAAAPVSGPWRWLAARSFFIYFWHLPFVGAVHVALYKTQVPMGVKVLLAFVAGVCGSAAVYALVRRTPMMRFFGESARGQG